MNGRAVQVGISQRVRVEWLEATINLVLAGNNAPAIEEALNEMLLPTLSVGSKTVRGSRHKTVTILGRIWHRVPPGLEPLRDAGLNLHPGLRVRDRQALHWGMTLAVYPFWGAVATQTGRLLRLQDNAAAAQVQRRVRESYGERQTVSRAAARVLRSYIDWGVLADTATKGMYTRGARHEIESANLAAWLAEAVLRNREAAVASASGLLRDPALFPYRLPPLSASQLASRSPRVEGSRQGLDEDMLMLQAMAAGRGSKGKGQGTKRRSLR